MKNVSVSVVAIQLLFYVFISGNKLAVINFDNAMHLPWKYPAFWFCMRNKVVLEPTHLNIEVMTFFQLK